MTTSSISQRSTLSQRVVFIILSSLAVFMFWNWYQSLLNERAYDNAPAPDFTAIENSDDRKQRFIEYLYPLIVEENNRVVQQRVQLLVLEKQLQDGGFLNAEHDLWLKRIASYYEVDYDDEDLLTSITLLRKRVDVIPPSLALAQAANETAWGTSRFAVDANNYFGEWCYGKGCGLVPLERTEGLSHEVRRFHSVTDSVSAYLHALNTKRAYAELRNVRQRLHIQQKRLTGHELAVGLVKYSQRGMAYVDSIRSLIASNKLQLYTDDFYASLQDWPGPDLRIN